MIITKINEVNNKNNNNSNHHYCHNENYSNKGTFFDKLIFSVRKEMYLSLCSWSTCVLNTKVSVLEELI